MKIALWIIIALVLLAVVVFVVAGLIGKKFFAGSRSKVFPNLSAENVWNYLMDVEALPSRRKEIKSVEILEDDKWKEYTDMGGWILFERTEKVKNKKLTLNMIESTFGMSGTWTYELNDTEKGLKVTIYEESNIDSFFAKAMMTLVGRDANLKQELRYIENSLSKN